MRNVFCTVKLKLDKVNFHLKVLKAEDVQDADGLEVVFSFDFLIDPHYDPGETLRIKGHGNRVPRVHRLQTMTQRETKVTTDTKSGINNTREETMQTVS